MDVALFSGRQETKVKQKSLKQKSSKEKSGREILRKDTQPRLQNPYQAREREKYAGGTD